MARDDNEKAAYRIIRIRTVVLHFTILMFRIRTVIIQYFKIQNTTIRVAWWW